MDDRAATETLGMVLLLALVILLATTIGLGLLAQTSAIEEGTERSYVNIDPTLNTSALTLTHAGGLSFQTSGLTLVLQNDTGRQRYDPGDFSVSGSPDTFEIGDRLSVSHNFTGYVEIALYSSETDERLYRAVRSTDSSTVSTPSAGGGSTAQIAALSQVAEGFSITLDGSGSTDADGSIVKYEWEIKEPSGNGTIVEDDTATPTAEYQAPADVTGDTGRNVTISLTVTDDDGNTDTETFEITVVNTDVAEAPDGNGDGDGDAFNDTNGNGVYDEGEEIVNKTTLENGYNDPDSDLVIYPSVGSIQSSGGPVSIRAKTISAGVDFTASGDGVNLIAEGDIRIDDVTLTPNSNRGINITSTGDRIFANRTEMNAKQGSIELNSKGDIYLESASLQGNSYNADLTTTSATLYVDQLSIGSGGGNGGGGDTLLYEPTVTIIGDGNLRAGDVQEK